MGFSTMSRRAQAQTVFAGAALCCAGWMVLYFNHVPERLLHPGRPIAAPANEYATGPMSSAAANSAPRIILAAPVAASLPVAAAPAKAVIAPKSAVAIDAAPAAKETGDADASQASPVSAQEIHQAPNAELKGVAFDAALAAKPVAALMANQEKASAPAAMAAASQKAAAAADQASLAFAPAAFSSKPAEASALAATPLPVSGPAVGSTDAGAAAVAAAMAQGSLSAAGASTPALDGKTTDKACLEWGPLPADALDALKTKLSADTALRGSASVRQVRYPAVWSVRFSYRSAYEKTQILKLLAAKKVQPAEIAKADREGAGLVVMGYFPTQEKAQALNAALAAIGVTDQLVTPIQPERVESSILFSNPTADTLTALKPYLANTNVFPRAIACPAALPQATASR